MAKKKKSQDVNTYLIVALAVVVALGLYFTLSVPTIVTPEPEPTPPPREITVTIVGGDCVDCFDVASAVDFIKQQDNLNITEEKEITLNDSSEIVEKYEITKLPAIILTGNVSNLTIPNFDEKEGALVFDQAPPPFYDVAEKRIRGLVDVISLEDQTCDKCFNMSQVVDQLAQVGVNMADRKTIDVSSVEGKGLIDKYKIEKIPTIIFSNDALEYDVVTQVWEQVGSVEEDGMLVLRFVNAPYINTSTGKVEGLVELTYLVDKECSECYDAGIFKQLFEQSFGMAFSSDDELDISSTRGQFLIKKYKIEVVPTVVLSKEANAYPNLGQAWTQVGSVEDDGSFVFREVKLLESFIQQTEGGSLVYKNVTSGEIVGLGEASVEEVEEPEEEPANETVEEAEPANATA